MQSVDKQECGEAGRESESGDRTGEMLLRTSTRRWAISALLVLVLYVGQSWVTYRLFTTRFPGANDFLGRWASGCSLFWYGDNPYSEEASLRSQLWMHGRPAQPGEDHAPFFYPLYALIFIAPFCVTQNYALVQAFWMILMLYVVLAGTVLAMAVARWRPARWLWGYTLVWTVLNYPHARAILLGQFNLIVFLGVGLTLYLMARRADLPAGACLAMTTVKPQMVFLFIPWLLWWTAHQRRWRFWVGFGGTMAVVMAASFVLVPTWFGDFMAQVTQYDDLAGTPYHSLTWIIVRHFLGYGPTVEAIVTAGLVAAVLLLMWRARRSQGDGMLWATAITLLLTNFVATRVATTGYPALLFALFFLFRRWGQSRSMAWKIVGIELALLVGQWALFLVTIAGNFETAAVYLPFPLLLMAALLWDRPTLEEEMTRD
jgi:hypothetical protein